MNYYLGIDIGTFSSKGVIVDQLGEIIAQASRPHKMLVPQAGWAEQKSVSDTNYAVYLDLYRNTCELMKRLEAVRE